MVPRPNKLSHIFSTPKNSNIHRNFLCFIDLRNVDYFQDPQRYPNVLLFRDGASAKALLSRRDPKGAASTTRVLLVGQRCGEEQEREADEGGWFGRMDQQFFVLCCDVGRLVERYEVNGVRRTNVVAEFKEETSERGRTFYQRPYWRPVAAEKN